jgi:membrane protease YdiL (CAAX protease family)
VREVFAVVWFIGVVLYFILVAVNLSTLTIASSLIVPGILEQDPIACPTATGGRGPCRANLFLLLPLPVPTQGGDLTVLLPGPRLTGIAFLGWFLLILWAVITSHLFLLWRDGRITWDDLRRAGGRMRAATDSSSGWITLAQIYGAVLFFDIVYIAILLPLMGIEPEVPTRMGEPLWFLLYALVNAAVYEEFLARLVYLGLLLGVLSILMGVVRRQPRPKPLDYLLGGKFPIDRLTLVPWVFSSVLFGLAHVLGGGWAPWKFVDTFIAGLALGYLFLRRGIAASILLHFSINYLAATALLATGGEEFNLVLSVGILIGLLLLILAIVGATFFLHYFLQAAKLFRLAVVGPPGRGQPTPAVGAAPLLPSGGDSNPSLGSPPFPLPGIVSSTCPRCGAVEADVVEGTLRCRRCGYSR